jgi:BRO family, N-terminal domain
MTTDDSKSLALFGQQTIRRVWHTDEWYYSIVDVIAVLTESANPRNYWNMLKARAKSEGFDAAMAAIVPLKLKSADNRFRLTETANRATLLRIIQSNPSPRAEPFRLWLAQVGDERLEEIENPEAAIARIRFRAVEFGERRIEGADLPVALVAHALLDGHSALPRRGRAMLASLMKARSCASCDPPASASSAQGSKSSYFGALVIARSANSAARVTRG